MTSTNRQGVADAFTACLPYLWDGKGKWHTSEQLYICMALVDSGSPYMEEACAVIEIKLWGSPTLRSWLIKQGVPPKDLTDARLQAHRKAWVKQLIKEFST